MKIKFWGTRGSIATPDPDKMRYGGDTPCLEVRFAETLFILDAGTGIRRLGAALMADSQWNKVGHILLSHFHWDHIQGFPFFQPAFIPGSRFEIYGAFKADNRLEDSLRGQMGSLYFPITMSDMPGSFTFHELLEQDFEIEGCKITTRQLNHPQGCYGYRIEGPTGYSMAYCTDTEPYEDGLDKKVVELAEGVDIFVCDAQFTPDEYTGGRKGWGHSTWHDAATMAKMAGCKKLVLFHHDPYHPDSFCDEMLAKAREIFPNTIAATRELELTIGTKMEESQAQMKAISRPQGSSASRATTPPSTATPQVQERGETILFSLPRDLAIFNSETFRNSVLDSLKEAHEQAIFDLSQLDFLDSSGIGSLAAIYNSTREKGIAMRLCAPSEQILDVLKITRFHKLVDIYSSEQDALQGQNALADA